MHEQHLNHSEQQWHQQLKEQVTFQCSEQEHQQLKKVADLTLQLQQTRLKASDDLGQQQQLTSQVQSRLDAAIGDKVGLIQSLEHYELECHNHLEKLRQQEQQLAELRQETHSQREQIKRLENECRQGQKQYCDLQRQTDTELGRFEDEVQALYLQLQARQTKEQELQQRWQQALGVNKQQEQQVVQLQEDIQQWSSKFDQLVVSHKDLSRGKIDCEEKLKALRFDLTHSIEQSNSLKQALFETQSRQNALQTHVDMERSKCGQLQSQLDFLATENKRLEASMGQDKARLRQREKDIEDLEVCLEDLKETMQTEFGSQLKEAETLKAELQELQQLNKKLNKQLDALTSQLKESQQLCDQKDGQKEKDLTEISGLQRTLAELECKNKRLADLLSSQLCSQAQLYQDDLSQKLLQPRKPLQTHPVVIPPLLLQPPKKA